MLTDARALICLNIKEVITNRIKALKNSKKLLLRKNGVVSIVMTGYLLFMPSMFYGRNGFFGFFAGNILKMANPHPLNLILSIFLR